MIAFVLSGAGNKGPLEVGALQALYEHGIQPDFVVGTSAGAINAMYVAARGLTATTAQEMTQLWLQATTDTIYPGNLLKVVWRLMSQSPSLYSGDGVRKMIQDALPAKTRTFADLKIPLYVVTTDLITSRLLLFGEEKAASVIDAVQASASVPVIHPPLRYGGVQLVDGGVVANVGIDVAIDKGATTIYLINASQGEEKADPAEGVIGVIGHTMNTMLAQSFVRGLDRAIADAAVDLHHIHIQAFKDLSFRDFSKTAEMVKVGREKTNAYLSAPRPRGATEPKPQTEPIAVPGAREYIPRTQR